MFSVKREENANKMSCSFPPRLVNFRRPVATSIQHPIDVAVACMTVSSHGDLTFE